jgi:molybdopterin-guanine dinucleotide biosynthesis protein A
MDNNTKIKDITAVILAGGKNTRMHQEKSLIKIQGIPLIDKQVEILESIFEKIIIVTNKDALKRKFPHLQIIDDEFKFCGPLGGIHAAMKQANIGVIFVFACDMPYLDAGIIHRQIEAYRATNVDILVPQHADGIEPLHAIYSQANLPFLEECLKSGRYSVRSFYEVTNAGYLFFEKKDIKYFFNINSDFDLKHVTN